MASGAATYVGGSRADRHTGARGRARVRLRRGELSCPMFDVCGGDCNVSCVAPVTATRLGSSDLSKL